MSGLYTKNLALKAMAIVLAVLLWILARGFFLK